MLKSKLCSITGNLFYGAKIQRTVFFDRFYTNSLHQIHPSLADLFIRLNADDDADAVLMSADLYKKNCENTLTNT